MDRLELKAGLLYEELGSPKDLERADKIVRDLLRRCPDQWSYYTFFFELLEKRYMGEFPFVVGKVFVGGKRNFSFEVGYYVLMNFSHPGLYQYWVPLLV